MVLEHALPFVETSVWLNAFISICSLITLVTLVGMCTCCKCCHRKLKQDEIDVAYGMSPTTAATSSATDNTAVQFRNGNANVILSKTHQQMINRNSARESSNRVESDGSQRASGTRRALPSLPADATNKSSVTRNSSTSELYATVDKVVAGPSSSSQLASTVFPYLDGAGGTSSSNNPMYDTIDAQSDLTDPLYSKVHGRQGGARYDYASYVNGGSGNKSASTMAPSTSRQLNEQVYQRVDDDLSELYAGGSEDPYSSIASESGKQQDDPGYEKVVDKAVVGNSQSNNTTVGTSSSAIRTTNLDHLYTKIQRNSATTIGDTAVLTSSIDNRAPLLRPLPPPTTMDGDGGNHGGNGEPSYRYITVRESLDVLRERMAQQMRADQQQQPPMAPPTREQHYYSTIGGGSEHGYEVVDICESVVVQRPSTDGYDGVGSREQHYFDNNFVHFSPKNTTSGVMEHNPHQTTTAYRYSSPPPKPPTSPIPDRNHTTTLTSSPIRSRHNNSDSIEIQSHSSSYDTSRGSIRSSQLLVDAGASSLLNRTLEDSMEESRRSDSIDRVFDVKREGSVLENNGTKQMGASMADDNHRSGRTISNNDSTHESSSLDIELSNSEDVFRTSFNRRYLENNDSSKRATSPLSEIIFGREDDSVRSYSVRDHLDESTIPMLHQSSASTTVQLVLKDQHAMADSSQKLLPGASSIDKSMRSSLDRSAVVDTAINLTFDRSTDRIVIDDANSNSTIQTNNCAKDNRFESATRPSSTLYESRYSVPPTTTNVKNRIESPTKSPKTQRSSSVAATSGVERASLHLEIGTGRGQITRRDYVSPIGLGTERSWPLNAIAVREAISTTTATAAGSPGHVSSPNNNANPRSIFHSISSNTSSHTVSPSTANNNRPATTTTSSGDSCKDGTCYCHSAGTPTQDRVWSQNLYEMEKIRWGQAARESSSEDSEECDQLQARSVKF